MEYSVQTPQSTTVQRPAQILLFLTYTLCALPTEMMEVFYNKFELVGKGVCRIIQVGRGIITGNPNEYGIR